MLYLDKAAIPFEVVMGRCGATIVLVKAKYLHVFNAL